MISRQNGGPLNGRQPPGKAVLRYLSAAIVLAGLPCAAQRNETVLKNVPRIEAAQVRAIADYRLPPPGSGPFQIEDGRWYRSLSGREKNKMFHGSDGRCVTLYGTLNCAALKGSLDWFYLDDRNLLIPYGEAEYIIAKEMHGMKEPDIAIELRAARINMGEYYAALKKSAPNTPSRKMK